MFFDKKHSKTKSLKVRALDETHLKILIFDYARTVLKKFIKIIQTEEI